jgi:3'(2'), 5'-bisphosphate nucleotidase
MSYPITIEQLCEIALNAGKAIMEVYEEVNLFNLKEDSSPLTKADLISHEIILSQLKVKVQNIPIISEEGEIPSFEERKNWSKFYLVDGLDGTKEFLKKTGDFTVNIALISDGIPVQGVVYAPALNKLYYAEHSRGSFKKQLNDSEQRIFSTNKKKGEALTVVASKSHRNAETNEFIKKLKVDSFVEAGSSLKFCLLAEGLADIYPRLSPTMEWDVAAGDCVFRNSTLLGSRESCLTYNKADLKNESFVIGSGF